MSLGGRVALGVYGPSTLNPKPLHLKFREFSLGSELEMWVESFRAFARQSPEFQAHLPCIGFIEPIEALGLRGRSRHTTCTETLLAELVTVEVAGSTREPRSQNPLNSHILTPKILHPKFYWAGPGNIGIFPNGINRGPYIRIFCEGFWGSTQSKTLSYTNHPGA